MPFGRLHLEMQDAAMVAGDRQADHLSHRGLAGQGDPLNPIRVRQRRNNHLAGGGHANPEMHLVILTRRDEVKLFADPLAQFASKLQDLFEVGIFTCPWGRATSTSQKRF